MKIFLFYFEIAIKSTGSAQNYRVGRVSGNTPIFRPKLLYLLKNRHITITGLGNILVQCIYCNCSRL